MPSLPGTQWSRWTLHLLLTCPVQLLHDIPVLPPTPAESGLLTAARNFITFGLVKIMFLYPGF